MLEEFYKGLKRDSLESFVLQVLGAACLFFMHSRLANQLTLEDYGTFILGLTIASTLVLVSTFGWPGVLTRLIPEYFIKKKWALLKGMLISSNVFTLILSLLLSCLLYYLSLKAVFPKKVEALFIAAILLPPLSLVVLRRRIFMALHNIRGSIIPDEIVLPSLVAVGLFLIPMSSANMAAYLYVAVALLVFIWTILWLYKLLPLQMIKISSTYSNKEWVILAFPFMVGGGAQILLAHSGVLILGYYNELVDVGLYSAAFKLTLFVTFTMTAINVIGMPLLATAFHNGNFMALKTIFLTTQLWSICGAIAVSVILFAFSSDFLELFGSEYLKATEILHILIVGQIANAASGLSGSLLIVADRQIYFANTMSACAILAFILMTVCTPIWGVLSIAIIFAGCMGLLSLMQYWGAKALLDSMQ